MLQALPPFPEPPETTTAHLLVRHPASPKRPVLSIEACVWPGAYQQVGGWNLRYVLTGDVGAVRIPTPQPAARADGLWQHTCLEAFVGQRGDAAYREFNFSPSGRWATYAFSDQRQRDRDMESRFQLMAPVIACSQSAASFSLQAWVPMAAWSDTPAGEPLELGLSAVIETRDGALSHWALHHPRPQPDFHHRGAFVARV